MAYVSVPKDLTKVKNKVAFNLTKRQLICIGIGATMGIPSYFLLRNVMGNSNAATVMVLLMSLKEALEVLEQEESDPENDEMIEIINSTVGKLQQIEDKYYYYLDLNYYLNNLEDDAYEA